MSSVALLVIAKEPLPGRAKTRLTPPCTAGQAAALAHASLLDTLDVVERTPAARKVLVFDGDARHWRRQGFVGVFALGVDLSPVAVELAIGGGGRAIVGDIFDEIPGGGTWRSALLLDGNIGIGGSPVRLLARIGALLQEGGEVLVELEPPSALTCSTEARIECDGVASPWFPWARVAVGAIPSVAAVAGFAVSAAWPLSERWFALLHRQECRSRRGQWARLGPVP